MNIEIEWIAGVIRVGNEKFKGKIPGTTYDFVCTILRQADQAYLMAAKGKFDRKTYKLIKDSLIGLGITKATWDRMNTEKPRKTEKKV